MARECLIAGISIIIMKWSAVFWYHLYLNVVHQPSDSIGHGVTSFRNYSTKNRAMARLSRIMQIGVPITPNRDTQKGTLAQKHRIGRPRQPTLHDGCQLLWLVCNGQTNSVSASRWEWQQLKICPYPAGWSKLGWLKQETVHNVQRESSCLP